MDLGPCILEGHLVRLEPLGMEHRPGLFDAAQAHDIWAWMSQNLSNPASMDDWMTTALEDQQMGLCYPFAVVDRRNGTIVGSTRYLNIHLRDRGVEIGWTWYTPTVWGTAINAEAKLLLLTHALDDWQALRVVFRTDHQNTPSQAAIRKLGAVYEGTLRNHRIRPDGSIRHTMVFSVTPDEWPQVQERLKRRISSS